MTTDQKPWRAEMPRVYSVETRFGLANVCDSDTVRSIVTHCNAELDAARARIAELEAAAIREHVTTLEFIEEMEDTRKALHEEKNRTHSLALRIAELEAASLSAAEDVCWHCLDCLEPVVCHCNQCPPPGECDDDDCQAEGCLRARGVSL